MFDLFSHPTSHIKRILSQEAKSTPVWLYNVFEGCLIKPNYRIPLRRVNVSSPVLCDANFPCTAQLSSSISCWGDSGTPRFKETVGERREEVHKVRRVIKEGENWEPDKEKRGSIVLYVQPGSEGKKTPYSVQYFICWDVWTTKGKVEQQKGKIAVFCLVLCGHEGQFNLCTSICRLMPQIQHRNIMDYYSLRFFLPL